MQLLGLVDIFNEGALSFTFIFLSKIEFNTPFMLRVSKWWWWMYRLIWFRSRNLLFFSLITGWKWFFSQSLHNITLRHTQHKYFENVSSKASYITPVPGGVGPMTIAMLMNNVIKATKEQNDKDSEF